MCLGNQEERGTSPVSADTQAELSRAAMKEQHELCGREGVQRPRADAERVTLGQPYELQDDKTLLSHILWLTVLGPQGTPAVPICPCTHREALRQRAEEGPQEQHLSGHGC